MNVIVLNDAAYIRGGADRVALESARGLAACGHDVTVFTAFGPVDPSLRDVRNLKVHVLGMAWLRQHQLSPSAALQGIWNTRAARRLREALLRFDRRESIVHVHLYASALSASVLGAAVAEGFTTVLTLHDYFITCPNGAYFIFPRAEPCEHRALSASCLACHCDSRSILHKPWRVARTWIQSRVKRIPSRLSGYVAVSRACAMLARRDLPASANIRLIPNMVSVDRRVPVAADRNRAFVFAGRLESYKGPQLLAIAAARLGVPAVFCGDGPLEAALRRLNPRARFTGWLSSEAVHAELELARAFVFPSVYRETFGLSAAEALARGVPVVASLGTAAEEFVQPGRNGFLFARNSADDLASQLRALDDSATVRRLSANAYEDYWAAPLTLENHLSRLGDFYGDLLAARSDDARPVAHHPANA